MIFFLPISVGSDCKLFLSTFKLFRLRSFPIVTGSSRRKFSVRINSCKFSHLQRININFYSLYNIKIFVERKINLTCLYLDLE